MMSTNVYNHNNTFTKGVLVNRIFSNKINGESGGADELRENIKRATETDKYAGVSPNAIEEHLKGLAARKITSSSPKPFFGLSVTEADI